ncbi:phosphoribosyltransferase [Candidatus Woesearchaeota archaeon]|nr:phosphoribosyltransferase [Candidatus Woesearchaeota archaeon]
MIFKDRFTAGKLLAKELKKYKNKKDTIILTIPRGGLQVGYSIAKELNSRLSIILTKKISYPGNSEYAIGTVGLTSEIIEEQGISKDYIKNEIKNIRNYLKERYKKYLGKNKPINLKNKLIIITDDGIATGKTMLLTIKLIKEQKPKKIIVAIPVGPIENVKLLKENADEVICLYSSEHFFAVGEFYENFEQVSDEKAISLLKKVQSSHKS